MSEGYIIGSGGGSNAGTGIPPSNCKNIIITKTSTTATLRWQDPDDTIIDGQTLCTWAGTKIYRKIGSYPISPSDSEAVFVTDNTTRNQYLTTGFTDSNLAAGTTYYYKAFPYSANGVYSLDNKNKFQDAIIYGFRIDTTDSNPITRVQYLSDCDNALFTSAAMNFTTGAFNYGSWENAFFMPKPCMLNNDGTVAYYLRKTDYTVRATGEASDIANSAFLGNAMMEWPQVWIKFTNNGSYQEVRISNKQVDSGYKCYTHYNRSGVLKDYMYTAIYDGSNVSSKLRSLSGLAPLNTATAQTEMTYAQANGASWTTGVLADWIMINMLLVLISKSTDTQTAFGNGHYTGGTAASSLISSGTMNTKGLFWGTNGTGSGVKVFGIENYFGNIWKRIAGWINASGTQKIKLTYDMTDGSANTGYNFDGTGYISIGLTPGGTSGGYISAATLNQYGLFPVMGSGSQTTYFTDGLWFNNAQSNYALVGGACNSGFLVGAFAANLANASSAADWYIGAALSCKP